MVAKEKEGITYSSEGNFITFWSIIEQFGKEMVIANRRASIERGDEFEPRHPTSSYDNEQEKYLKNIRNVRKLIAGTHSTDITTGSDYQKEIERLKSNINIRKLNDLGWQIDTVEIEGNKMEGSTGSIQTILETIDSLWKGNDTAVEGYFEKYYNEDFSLFKKSTGDEQKKNLGKACVAFVDRYLNNPIIKEAISKKIEEIETALEKENKRIIPKECNTVYESYGRQEVCYPLSNFYGKNNEKNTESLDTLYKNIDKVPIGSYIEQLIKEGGTNLTCDSVFSKQFALMSNNAILYTDGAIPTGNILATSELPTILKNIHKDKEKTEKFIENNPSVPFTNRSDNFYISGEYLLEKYKEKAGEKELDAESEKKFTANIFEELKRDVDEYLRDKEKLKELEKELEEIKGKELEEEKELTKGANEFGKNLSAYKLNKEKLKRIQKLYGEQDTEQIKEAELRNLANLKIQEEYVKKSKALNTFANNTKLSSRSINSGSNASNIPNTYKKTKRLR
jgi:hypothetical protein